MLTFSLQQWLRTNICSSKWCFNLELCRVWSLSNRKPVVLCVRYDLRLICVWNWTNLNFPLQWEIFICPTILQGQDCSFFWEGGKEGALVCLQCLLMISFIDCVWDIDIVNAGLFGWIPRIPSHLFAFWLNMCFYACSNRS